MITNLITRIPNIHHSNLSAAVNTLSVSSQFSASKLFLDPLHAAILTNLDLICKSTKNPDLRSLQFVVIDPSFSFQQRIVVWVSQACLHKTIT